MNLKEVGEEKEESGWELRKTRKILLIYSQGDSGIASLIDFLTFCLL